MANDRIYLKCKECGQLKLLFTYWPDGVSLWSSLSEEKIIELEEWVNTHLHSKMGRFSLEGDPGFTLETE